MSLAAPSVWADVLGNGIKMAQDCRKMAPDGLNMASRWPQIASKWLQTCPKIASKWPQDRNQDSRSSAPKRLNVIPYDASRHLEETRNPKNNIRKDRTASFSRMREGHCRQPFALKPDALGNPSRIVQHGLVGIREATTIFMLHEPNENSTPEDFDTIPGRNFSRIIRW